jgi:hypothetical protein
LHSVVLGGLSQKSRRRLPQPTPFGGLSTDLETWKIALRSSSAFVRHRAAALKVTAARGIG